MSLSRYTTSEDIDAATGALERVLYEMETTVRFIPCK
jgi:hypothetical protein